MRALLHLQLQDGDIDITQTLVDLSMNLPADKFKAMLTRVAAQQLPDCVAGVFNAHEAAVAGAKTNEDKPNAKAPKTKKAAAQTD